MYKFFVVYRESGNDITLEFTYQSDMLHKVNELKSKNILVVQYGATKG